MAGVVRKSDRKLLSHALCNHAGAIFILFTEPEERRKGYASLLIGSIVRESNKRQRTPIALISNANSSTENLYKQFNFVPFIPVKYYGVTKTWSQLWLFLLNFSLTVTNFICFLITSLFFMY